MVEIRFEYSGELRCNAVHGPSAAALHTDAPVDNHGKGESFSPTDLVATALGSCMLTVMGIAARKNGWDMDGATATVNKGMVADPRRRIGSLQVEIHMPHELDAGAREQLEKIAHTCPVFESLNPAIDVPVQFRWGAAASAG